MAEVYDPDFQSKPTLRPGDEGFEEAVMAALERQSDKPVTPAERTPEQKEAFLRLLAATSSDPLDPNFMFLAHEAGLTRSIEETGKEIDIVNWLRITLGMMEINAQSRSR